MQSLRGSMIVLVSAIAVIASSVAWGQGQMPMPHHHEAPAAPAAPPPIRTTMEALHAQGGVPTGWKFLMPPGDAAKGRNVFASMKCFTCHEIKGEKFPLADKKPGDVGPELTGMGQHHPPEYFAESIVNPNRIILEGPGYTSADGASKMPEYADTMTVRQLIDLVAYIRSLRGGGMDDHGMATHGHDAHAPGKAMDTSGHDMKGMSMPGHETKKP